MTVAEFRAAMPDFGDAAKYPDSAVQGWLDLAALLLNATRWRSVLTYGTQLFVAHNLTLSPIASGSANPTGLISDKAVGPVKVSYDVEAGIDPKAGHWNLTVYGRQFYYYMKMAGAGGVQIVGCGSAYGQPTGVLWR